jgi:hypothetical protein
VGFERTSLQKGYAGSGIMSTRQMWKRLEKVETRLCPKHDDGQYTLEELCRDSWRQDRAGYRKMYSRDRMGEFIPRFEREDLESRSPMAGITDGGDLVKS